MLATSDPAVCGAVQADCSSLVAVTENSELGRYHGEWQRLAGLAAEPNVFMSWEWYMAWLHPSAHPGFPGVVKPYLLLRQSKQRIEAITPLVRFTSARFGFPVRKLQFATPHSDYNEIAVGSGAEAQAQALALFLKCNPREWDVVDMRNVRASRSLLEVIQQALRRSRLPFTVQREVEGCPYLSIDGDANSVLEKRFSGDARRTLRQRMQKARVAGLRARIIEQPQNEEGLLQTLIGLEAKKMLRSPYPPLLGTYPQIFQQLFQTLGPRGELYVALLEQGAQAVAFQMGFRCKDKLWDYSKAFDRQFSRFAPGALLVAALLDYGFEKGYREYDFLRGEEEYKSVWTKECHRSFRLLIWNRRLGSRIRKLGYYDLKAALFRLLGRGA